MLNARLLAVLLAVALATACGGGDKGKGATVEAQSAETQATTAGSSQPDFGGVSKQYIEVEGAGPTYTAAVNAALLDALRQVNGVDINEADLTLTLKAAVDSGGGEEQIGGTGFAQALATSTQGRISDFKVISKSEKSKGVSAMVKGQTGWVVKIGANIAVYRDSADSKRPRIAIALPKADLAAYPMGDREIAASELQRSIYDQVRAAVTDTRRFTVVERQDTADIQQEMDLISSGSVRKEDSARLGQLLATDLIVIPRIDRFEYVRQARTLRLSGRELVSYSGGARMAFTVVNAATGQVILAKTFDAEFPAMQPTTLGGTVDGGAASSEAMKALTGHFISSLLQATFPVSVIRLDGDRVVLSQGGAAVRVGARYDAVLLGDEMTDPQTGEKLGRSASPFGVIRIERSEDKLSYGVLEGAPPFDAAKFKPGSIELRGESATVAATTKPEAATAVSETVAAEAPVAPAAKPRAKSEAAAEQPEPEAKPESDDNW